MFRKRLFYLPGHHCGKTPPVMELLPVMPCCGDKGQINIISNDKQIFKEVSEGD